MTDQETHTTEKTAVFESRSFTKQMLTHIKRGHAPMHFAGMLKVKHVTPRVFGFRQLFIMSLNCLKTFTREQLTTIRTSAATHTSVKTKQNEDDMSGSIEPANAMDRLPTGPHLIHAHIHKTVGRNVLGSFNPITLNLVFEYLDDADAITTHSHTQSLLLFTQTII
jgi:hypothetical protein